MKKLENLRKAKKYAKESNDPEELKKHQIESLDQEIAKTAYELWPNKQAILT